LLRAIGAEPCEDRDILLAASLEGHRRGVEACPDVDLPELVERRVVVAAKVPSVKPVNTKPPAVESVPL